MTSEGSHDFARVRRIVKTDEFSSVFRLRPAQKTAHFVLYTRPNELPHARLGVVVAKRFAPRAVTRNTIKRVTRELFRMAQLPARRLHRAPVAPGQHQGRPGHHRRAEGGTARGNRAPVRVAGAAPRRRRPRHEQACSSGCCAPTSWRCRRCWARTAAFIRPARITRSKRCAPMAPRAAAGWPRAASAAATRGTTGGVDPVPPAHGKHPSTAACGCNHS